MCNVRCWRPSSQTAAQPRVSIGRCVRRLWWKAHSTTRCASRLRAATSPVENRLHGDEVGGQRLVHPRRAFGERLRDSRRPRAAARTPPRRARRRPRRGSGSRRRRRRPGRRGSAPCRPAASSSPPAAGPRSAAPCEGASSTARDPRRYRRPRRPPIPSRPRRRYRFDARMRVRRAHEAGVQERRESRCRRRSGRAR